MVSCCKGRTKYNEGLLTSRRTSTDAQKLQITLLFSKHVWRFINLLKEREKKCLWKMRTRNIEISSRARDACERGRAANDHCCNAVPENFVGANIDVPLSNANAKCGD